MNNDIYAEELSEIAAPAESDDPTDDSKEIARRVFLVLERLDAPSRRKHPAVITVFRLYCMEHLSVTEIARKCRCSLGTVSNRLKLVGAATGAHPAHLRNLTNTDSPSR